MDFHTPDPSFTSTSRARDNFRLAVRLTVGFVAFVWFIALTNWATDLVPDALGIRPRELSGLVGVLLAPLLHADFAHLLSNTPPLLVLGPMLLYLYPASAFKVLPAVYLGPGIAVWLAARDGVHLGASGLVYGLVSYVLVAGLLRRDRRAVAASLVVCFMYGALVWGVLPIRHGVSWETHLAAALIGVALAIVFRSTDIPPRRRYTWEHEQQQWDDEPPAEEPSREGAPGGVDANREQV